MLELTFKDKEDMIKKINNGEVQSDIYDYLGDIIYNHTYYEDMYQGEILSKDTVFEYFEAQFEEFFVTSLEIIHSKDEVASTLRNVITNVYKRFVDEIEIVKKKNEYILTIADIKEDFGFYYDEYNKNLLDVEDKNEIVKNAMEFYEKIKNIMI